MATNNITFKIGTLFSGEGLKKAMTATGEMGKQLSASKQGAVALQQALAGMDSSAAQALNSIVGLCQGFSKMSVVSVAVQAEMLLIQKLTASMVEEADALLERMNELHARAQESLFGNLKTDAPEIAAQLKQMTAEFAQLNKNANAFAAAINGLNQAEGRGSILQLHIEKFQAVVDESTEQMKAVTAAEYDVQIAEEQKKLVIEDYTAKLSAAGDAYEQNAKMLEATSAALENAQGSLEEAQRKFDIVAENYESGSEEYKAAQAALVAAKQLVTDLDLKEADLRSKSTELEVLRQTAEQNLINATDEQTLKVQEATQKLDELTQLFANDGKNSVSEFIAAAQESVEAMRVEEMKELNTQLADLTRQQNESKSALIEAERAYAAAVSEYAANFAANKVNEAYGDYYHDGKSSSKSGILPVDVQKSVSTQVADAKVDDAIRNGTIGTVKEADRARRDAERQARDMMGRNSGTRAQEAKRYERLMEQGENALSEQDKHFVTEYRKIQEAQKASKEKVDAAKEALDAVKKATEESKRSIDAIKTKINELTIK